ncbi:hypothetical protein [Candidatus Nitrososphaera gargensis]|uniref:hypothetical protein n=1 Tax=Candidatus Nitrososphaera gargensis TaxID=497727 RepID=UPI0011E583D8|nr:hypothetical protein [Candidatus Nitrososphaera gargensis]
MPVVSDSYMGIFMPPDISFRIKQFMAAKVDFPFIRKDELMAAFYLFGKDYGVPESEVKAATDIAKTTVEQVARDIRLYAATPQKMDARFTRENYTKRSLQIVVDSGAQADLDSRVAGDPAILSDCFAQHVAYHKQGFFFELFHPFKGEQLSASLKNRLEGRMLLLGFNVKDRQSLPFKSSLEPFFKWMLKV